MNEEANESPLMARLRKVGDLTLTGSKPQGLPLSEIKERVMAFMFANENLSGVIAFGDGVDKDDVPDWTCHAFVPLRLVTYAAFASKAKGLFQPSAECLRRGL